MKKFLSLVLALVMTMSLVTISAGAKDFTDNDKVNYDEAVQVISLLGVVNGYEDGSFKPANTLTRGAAAKIICNLLLTPAVADTLPANNTGFKDVPSTNVFAKYIAYCANAKIINGYSDGTFRPAATLTGFAFMKMLMGALGYDAQIEGFTGETFALNVATKVGELKLADGNDAFVGTKAVTREEAALYAFNMLNTKMVKYASKGTKITVNGVEIIQGASPATETGSTFAATKFPGLKEGNDADGFGRNYKTWTYKGTTVKLLESKADKVYYGSVNVKKIYSDLKLNKATPYTVTVFDETVTGIADGEDFYNWTMKQDNKDVVKAFGGLSYMVEVYYTAATKDADAKINIIPVEYKLGTVESVNKAQGLTERSITIKNVSGSYTTDSFAKGDVVLYTVAKGSIDSVQLAKSVEGKVTYAKGNKVTVNGVSYTADPALGLTAGSNGTYYLGIDSSIIGFNGQKSVSVDSFVKVYSVVEVDGTVTDDGLTVTGGYRAYFVKADGTKDSAMIASKEVKKDNKTETVYDITDPGVYPYALNSDGEFTLATYDEDAIGTVAPETGKTATVGKNNAKVLNTYMTSATKFVFVDTTNGKLTISAATGYKNVETKTAEDVTVIYDKATKNALVVFVGGKVGAAETEATYAFLADEVPGVSGEINDQTYTFTVVGGVTELTAAKADIFEKAGVKAGDRFSYTLKDGKLATVTKDKNFVTGEVSAKNDDYVVIGNGDPITVAADCVTYLLNDDGLTASSYKVGDTVKAYTNGKEGNDLRIVAIVVTTEG